MSDLNTLFQAALEAINQNRFEAAQKTLVELNTKVPGQAEILSFLGFAEANLGLKGALARTTEAAKLAPNNPQVLMHHAFALDQSGDKDGALLALEAANRLAPNQPPILNQLTRLLVEKGDFEGALPLAKTLIAGNPSDPVFANRYVQVLVGLERGTEALEYVEGLEKKLPPSTFLTEIKARAARAAQNWPLSYRLYKKLVAENPERLAYKRGLAHALMGLEDFSALVPVLKEIFKADPSNEKVLYSMAFALFNDHRHEECAPFVEKLLAKNPDDVDTLIIKGRSKIFFGEFEEAKGVFTRVLELAPEHPMAIMQLTKIDKPAKGDAIFTRMEEMEKTTTDEHDYRALMGYTLGEMYEGIEDYDRAFEFFQKGNERAKERFAKRGFLFDRKACESDFQNLRTLYSKENLAAMTGAGDDSPLPIFIVGMPRSGTTLLEQIISGHSRVHGAGELPLGPAAAQKLYDDLGQPTAENVKAALNQKGKDYAHLYLDYLPEREDGQDRLSDKMPNNFMHLGFLQTVLPNASYILIRRNPLDICLSMYKGFFGPGFTHALDLEDLGFYYRQFHELMDYWKQVLPGPLLEIRYEDFVADAEGQGKKVLEFCNLDWEEGLLDFHKRKNKVITMSAIQVREPVHQKAIDKWRRYEKHLGPLLKGLGDDIVKTLDI